jgi:hypothetical protein
MHIYTIHEHGDTPPGERDPHAVFVREGFSLFALLFSILWFMFHRMWRETVLIAVAITLIFVIAIGGDLGTIGGNALRMVFSLGVAVFAHDIWRAALARRGFREVGVASGSNVEEAALEYLLRPDAAKDAVIPAAPEENKEPIGE